MFSVSISMLILSSTVRLDARRFVDPLINGQYPQIMQDLVKERLPRFTPDQAEVVKGSADYIGINQYTASYMKGQKLLQQPPTSYSADWQVDYACEYLVILTCRFCINVYIAINVANLSYIMA
jgi:beta-glucosidase/6-phospho-beta-glucosidase/beta-galactosidase